MAGCMVCKHNQQLLQTAQFRIKQLCFSDVIKSEILGSC